MPRKIRATTSSGCSGLSSPRLMALVRRTVSSEGVYPPSAGGVYSAACRSTSASSSASGMTASPPHSAHRRYNVYYHKNAEIERITITGPEEASGTGDEQLTAPDPQPTQMSLAQVGGSDFELSEENAKTILQILDSGSWVSDATKCASDCVLNFDGRTVYYHSDCGTFNERLEQSYQSLHLSDAERETVNAIIQEVIPYDLRSCTNR